MTVSLVTVSYNRPRLLANTLRSIGYFDEGFDEIVVVEDIREHKAGEFLNPAPLWNKALSIATSDILILQNPECLHLTNIAAVLSKVPKGEAWFASCQAVDKLEHFSKWYCHPEMNPRPLFFCGAIHREDMVFYDESFTEYGYEDNALAECLKRKGIAFRFLPPEQALVMHQWHPEWNVASQSLSLYREKYGD